MPRVKKDKITHQEIVNTVNHETGEVTNQEKITHVTIETEPNYVKLYINTLLAFKELPSTMNALLVELLSYMTYANGEADSGGQLIIISGYVKQQIAAKLNFKLNTVEHNITRLIKSGILKRLGSSTYQVNPYMFGKGEWKDIKAIQATFNFNTGEIKAEIEKNGKKNRK